jgi:DNA-binding CsgD family transcriptional regulator
MTRPGQAFREIALYGVFDKLGARRRTEAVQLGKSWRLIP